MRNGRMCNQTWLQSCVRRKRKDQLASMWDLRKNMRWVLLWGVHTSFPTWTSLTSHAKDPRVFFFFLSLSLSNLYLWYPLLLIYYATPSTLTMVVMIWPVHDKLTWLGLDSFVQPQNLIQSFKQDCVSIWISNFS